MKVHQNRLSIHDYNVYWLVVVRISLSLFFGKPRLNMILNGCVVAVDLALKFYIPWDADYAVRWEMRSSQYVWREVSILGAISIMYLACEQFELMMAKAFLRAQKSDQSFYLVRRLLVCMCDAVARLDTELLLTEPCPALSAMLLRHGPIPDGTKLTDLMHSEEDAERFRSCILAAASSNALALHNEGGQGEYPESAGLCHVEFKDGSGSRLRAHLYYSCLPTPSGQWDCLVGIQENHDEGAARVPEAPDSEAGAMHAARVLATLPERSSVLCTSNLGSASSLSEGTSRSQPPSGSSTSNSQVSGLGGELTISIKAVGGYVVGMVCECPESWNVCLDIPLGNKLQLHMESAEDFVTWFNDVMRRIVSNQIDLPLSLRMGPTFFKRRKKRVMLDVTVHFPELDTHQDINQYVVSVTLTRSGRQSQPASHQEQTRRLQHKSQMRSL
jgi:hypothetical protein